MWRRIAAHYPVWYEPRPLACFCQGAHSETHRLLRSGEQVADALAAIDLAGDDLPPARRAELAERAREHHAFYAIDLAQRLARAGEDAAAAANLRVAAGASASEAVQRAVARLQRRLAVVGHG
jgi:hypothetical protein